MLRAAEPEPKPLSAVLITGDRVAAQHAGVLGDLPKGRVKVEYKPTPSGPGPDLTGFIQEII